MLSAYVESLKLRIGVFIGMAAVLGYLATLRRAPSPGELALLFVTVVAAAAGAGALNHYLDRDLDRLMRRTAGRPLAAGRARARVLRASALVRPDPHFSVARIVQ